MYIRHNITAVNTLRNLSSTNKEIKNNTAKLASAMKINQAGDDVAGLSISEKLRAQISGLSKVNLNAQNGISLVQTAEGALEEVHRMLHRVKELSVQSSNDTNTENDRLKLNEELDELLKQVNKIGIETTFNTRKIFNENTELTFQLGANSEEQDNLVLNELSIISLDLNDVNILTQEDASFTISKVDQATEKISSQRSYLGAWKNRLEHIIKNVNQTSDNLASSNSIIRDTNVASEIMKLTKNEILRDNMESALSHSNVKNNWVLDLLN